MFTHEHRPDALPEEEVIKDDTRIYAWITAPPEFVERIVQALNATEPMATSSPHGYHVFCNFRGELMVYQGPHWSRWSNTDAGMLPDTCSHLFTLPSEQRDLAHALVAMLNMRQGQLARILTIYDQLMTALHISSDHAMLGEHVERIIQNNGMADDGPTREQIRQAWQGWQEVTNAMSAYRYSNMQDIDFVEIIARICNEYDPETDLPPNHKSVKDNTP